MKNGAIEALRKERDELSRFAKGLIGMLNEVCNAETFRRLAADALKAVERISSMIEREVCKERSWHSKLCQCVAGLFKPWFDFCAEVGR